MLIQAHCQQEREKRCTITANTTDSNSNDKTESNTEQSDTNESSNPDDDGAKTPKNEPNASPKTNDVEMVDASDPIPTIKQEPEDEVTSIETDPLAETTTDENTSKMDESSDAQQDIQVVKTEADENGNVDGNDSNKESNKDSQSDSTDEPIKIEESTSDKDDPYSKDINIDPRTYCKLGHFHLLLEDYAKGIVCTYWSFGTIFEYPILDRVSYLYSVSLDSIKLLFVN